MCEAVRWWSMLVAWGILSFNVWMVVINFRVMRKLDRDRADYQQLLEVISHDHARFMMRHTEVMN